MIASAQVLGSRLAALLTSSARCMGVVRGVYPRAANLQADDGAWLSLVAEECGPSPMAATLRAVDLRRLRLSPGDRFLATASELRFDHAAVTLDAARRFDGRLPGLPAGCTPAVERLWKLALCGGSSLLPRAADGQSLSPTTRAESSLVEVATAAIAELVRAMRSRTTPGTRPATAPATPAAPVALRAAVARLVGLGPGLTPAGDDFLVGFLAACQATGQPARRDERLGHDRHYPGAEWDQQAVGQLSAVLGQMVPRTTSLSASMLLAAAEGAFAARLCELAQALAAAGDVDPAAAALLAVGSSSGADTLLGFAVGLTLREIPRA